ncbi:hypothetical protein RIF29_15466 [Crotalaria pallida]|uniref:Uncharacterized protein n=1 Tax=Crotalaria pallida TaxID=3830 RepID=A0AAN9FH93_CROPI
MASGSSQPLDTEKSLAIKEGKRQAHQAGDEYGFPEDLYQMLNREYVFIIEVRQRFHIDMNRDNYGVLYISYLEEHIKEFPGTHSGHEGSSTDKYLSANEDDQTIFQLDGSESILKWISGLQAWRSYF